MEDIIEGSESADGGRGLIPLSVDPVGNMRTTLKDFFKTSKFSDLIIRTGDQEFKVHKIVVCGQSEYFARLLSGNWKVCKDDMNETITNAIELKEDDVRAVEAMLHFMYGFDYDSSGSGLGRASPMLFNALVHKVADKYRVPALKHLARQKFDAAVSTCWNMDDFPHVISEVYTTTDKGLQNQVVSVSHQNIQSLLVKEDFMRVLNDTPSFAADVLQLLVKEKKKPSVRKYECPHCDEQLEANLLNDLWYHCIHCGKKYSDWKSCLV